VRLCPWADVVYGCDGPWWKNNNGLPKFSGLKLSNDQYVCTAYRDLHKVYVQTEDRMLFDEPAVIGTGGNSGFQAINLACQFGATRILLIGFDMHGANGVHWYGLNNPNNMNNPGEVNFVRWRNALNSQSGILAAMGVDVVNTSPSSALVCFRQQSIDKTLGEWGYANAA